MILHLPYGRDIVFYSKLSWLLATISCLLFARPKSYGSWAGLGAILFFVLFLLQLEPLLFLENYFRTLSLVLGLLYAWDVALETSPLIFENKRGSITSAVWLIALVLTIIGVLFKIQHYPGADLMPILGLVLGACTMLYDTFSKSKD